jgi:hypothetical protein
MIFLSWLLIALLVLVALAYVTAPGWAWAIGVAALAFGGWMTGAFPFLVLRYSFLLCS